MILQNRSHKQWLNTSFLLGFLLALTIHVFWTSILTAFSLKYVPKGSINQDIPLPSIASLHGSSSNSSEPLRLADRNSSLRSADTFPWTGARKPTCRFLDDATEGQWRDDEWIPVTCNVNELGVKDVLQLMMETPGIELYVLLTALVDCWIEIASK